MSVATLPATTPRALVVLSVPSNPITTNLPQGQTINASGTGSSTALALQSVPNQVVLAPMSYKIEFNAHGVIDSASIEVPIAQCPDLGNLVPAGNALPIAIYAGFPSNPAPGGYTYSQLNQRFIGTVDQSNPEFNIDKQTVTIPCISFGAVLTRNKTTTNLGGTGYGQASGVTTTQYIGDVCKRFNITPNIQVDNPASMQQVYTTNQLIGLQNLKYWDIIMYCSQTDGTLVWFDGKTLNYLSPNYVKRTLQEVRYGDLVNGVESFTGQHALQYSKNIEVEVRSYSTKETTSYRTRVNGSNGMTTTSYSQKYTQQNFGLPGSSSITTTTNESGTTNVTSGASTSKGGEQSSGTLTTPNASVNERYIFKRWGLTQAQCDKLAQQLWIQLSAHEFRGTFKMPMSAALLQNLKITNKFHVTPAANSTLPWWSSFSQDYIPLRITENMSVESGWDVEVLGINGPVPNTGAS